jgi:hypothetical protein
MLQTETLVCQPHCVAGAVLALAQILVAIGAGGLGPVTAAAAESAKLSKEQAETQAAYDKALRGFRAVLAERRAQIEAKAALPERPGQALYLARLQVMSTYKDLTDAVPARIGRANRFGIPPAFFDAALEPLLEEYTRLFGITQAPPADAQASRTPFKDVVKGKRLASTHEPAIARLAPPTPGWPGTAHTLELL